MAVSPRKITKKRKRTRFTNSSLIPQKKALSNVIHNLKKCTNCNQIIRTHFSCVLCLRKKLISSFKKKK